MFIRSSTAINDCLVAWDIIGAIYKEGGKSIEIMFGRNKGLAVWEYENTEFRDKAFEELCLFLSTNYKLRDFT